MSDDMFDTCPSCGLSKDLPHVVSGLRKKKEKAEAERDEALADLSAQDHIIARLTNENKELEKHLLAEQQECVDALGMLEDLRDFVSSRIRTTPTMSGPVHPTIKSSDAKEILDALKKPIRFGPNSNTKKMRQEVTLNFYDEEPAGP